MFGAHCFSMLPRLDPPTSRRNTPIFFDRPRCKERSPIERLFGKLKNWCHAVTRHEQRAGSLHGFVAIAEIKLQFPFVDGTQRVPFPRYSGYIVYAMGKCDIAGVFGELLQVGEKHGWGGAPWPAW